MTGSVKACVGFTVATVIVCAACTAAVAAEAEGAAAEKRPAKMPTVALTKAHEALCKVKVDDTMPDISAERLDGGAAAKLSSLGGKKATVVVFWKADRRMAREQLADMGPDVVEPFGKAGVAVVGVAVAGPAADAQAALKAAGAGFPNLLDADGKAFAQVGSEKLPRTYLVDPQGKILWFDIEYSHGTRRELREALRAVAGEPAPTK
jgi:peroxiredoxin